MRGWTARWGALGPGIAVAATGVGAGDLVAAAVGGARYGHALLWTVVIGAALKYAITEAIASWQLRTGTTVVEGWVTRLGRPAALFVLVYLILWSLIVAAALMSACGLATHAVLPGVDTRLGAVLHALAALAVVWTGRYAGFERAMKGFIALMFVTILGSAALSPPPIGSLLRGLVPFAPSGSLAYALAVLGGVGGTVTLLSYGYWMREKGWTGRESEPRVRVDLAVAYGLTGVFGLAIMALAGEVLFARGLEVKGNAAVLTMAEMLGGRVGSAIFLAGFWGAVASSLLGVWQGVPYLFADLWGRMTAPKRSDTGSSSGGSPVHRRPAYRGFLLFMTFPPMLLLFMEPVGLVVAYAALGALFMPFLALTLLLMLNRGDWTGGVPNSRRSNVLLVASVAVFVYLGVQSLVTRFG